MFESQKDNWLLASLFSMENVVYSEWVPAGTLVKGLVTISPATTLPFFPVSNRGEVAWFVLGIFPMSHVTFSLFFLEIHLHGVPRPIKIMEKRS